MYRVRRGAPHTAYAVLVRGSLFASLRPPHTLTTGHGDRGRIGSLRITLRPSPYLLFQGSDVRDHIIDRLTGNTIDGLHLTLPSSNDLRYSVVTLSLDLSRPQVSHIHLHHFGDGRIRCPIHTMAGLAGLNINRLSGLPVGSRSRGGTKSNRSERDQNHSHG